MGLEMDAATQEMSPFISRLVLCYSDFRLQLIDIFRFGWKIRLCHTSLQEFPLHPFQVIVMDFIRT